MKKYLFILLFFTSLPNVAQEFRVDNFLEFKNMKFGYIEEFLILNGWDFKGTETNKRLPGGFEEIEYTPGSGYSAVIYEYVNNKGQKIVLTVTEHDGQEKKEVQLESESKELYEKLLLGFKALNFDKTGEKDTMQSSVVEEVEEGQRMVINTTPEFYKKGKALLHATIKEYAILEDVNTQEGTYSYRPESVTQEYVLIF